MTAISPAPEHFPVGKLDRRPDAGLRGHVLTQQHWLVGCRTGSMILPNLLLINQNVQDNPQAGEPSSRFPTEVWRAR
jgi:hypothetical protein